MNGTEQLLVITEVSVALAGFAGVVAAYQYKDGTNVTRGDALGLAMLVNIGLLDAFFSVLPLAIFNVGVSEQVTWMISSGLMCVNYSIFTYYVVSNMKRVKVRKMSSKLAYAFLYIAGAGILIINILNTLQINFHGEFGPFFLSLILPLILAGYMFARLILRPLWRNIHAQESSELTAS